MGKRKMESDKLLFARATELMEQEHAYLDVELSLNDMAARLGRSRTSLSSVINRETGRNFSLWVAEYRVKHFIEHAGPSWGIDSKIDYQRHGFSSRSSFYRLFRVITECSPHEYFYKHRVG